MSNEQYQMQMINIVPQPYLSLVKTQNYHMALAHLIGAEGMETYTKFHAQTTGYVILDNGVIEDSQVTIKDLVAKANIIHAQEIILPDIYKDARATINSIADSLEWIDSHKDQTYENGKPKFKIQVVPQGDSFESWVKCANTIINNFGSYIDVIGIPKHLIDTCMNRDARLLAIDELAEINGMFEYFDIHLLGCWEAPLEVLFIAKACMQGIIPEVRSCDSAIAYVFAREGLKFSDAPRPNSKAIDFERGHVENEMLLQYNIATWIDTGNASPNKPIFFM